MLGTIYFYINLQPVNITFDSFKRNMVISNLNKEP